MKNSKIIKVDKPVKIQVVFSEQPAPVKAQLLPGRIIIQFE